MAKWPIELQETVKGEPLTVGERTIVPVAQVVSLLLRFPGGGGGFVWNRPAALLEVTESGTRRVPIRDVTRDLLIGLAVMSFLVSLMMGLAARKR
jgi:hypothetical protein